MSRGSPYAGHTDADIYVRKMSGKFARLDCSVQAGSHWFARTAAKHPPAALRKARLAAGNGDGAERCGACRLGDACEGLCPGSVLYLHLKGCAGDAAAPARALCHDLEAGLLDWDKRSKTNFTQIRVPSCSCSMSSTWKSSCVVAVSSTSKTTGNHLLYMSENAH